MPIRGQHLQAPEGRPIGSPGCNPGKSNPHKINLQPRRGGISVTPGATRRFNPRNPNQGKGNIPTPGWKSRRRGNKYPAIQPHNPRPTPSSIRVNPWAKIFLPDPRGPFGPKPIHGGGGPRTRGYHPGLPTCRPYGAEDQPHSPQFTANVQHSPVYRSFNP